MHAVRDRKVMTCVISDMYGMSPTLALSRHARSLSPGKYRLLSD